MKNNLEEKEIPDYPIPDTRSEEFKKIVGEWNISQDDEKSSQDGLKQARDIEKKKRSVAGDN